MDHEEYYEMKFIENFVQFGALHRARVSWILLKDIVQLQPAEDLERGSAALEIVQTYMNACEDLALWLQALESWSKTSGVGLKRALADARFGGPRKNPMNVDPEFSKRVGKLQSGSAHDLAIRYGLPYQERDDWDWIRPEDRAGLKGEIEKLMLLLNAIFGDVVFSQSTVRHLTIWRAWNKTKHGLHVTYAGDHALGPLLTFHMSPDDPSDLFHVRVVGRDLEIFMAKTFLAGVFLGRLIRLMFAKRYGTALTIEWLLRAEEIDHLALRRNEIGEIVMIGELQRHDLVIDPNVMTMPVPFVPSWRMGFADD